MIGKSVDYFEIREDGNAQTLLISIDESAEAFSVSGARVGKKEEPRGEDDLEAVVKQLSQQVRRDEADYLALSRKLTAAATFIEQKIDRIQRRAEFEQQRESGKSGAFGREIEDLQGILRKLKEPNQALGPAAPSGRGSS